MMQTGYFAHPIKMTFTKVHAIQNGKPFCGCKLGNGMEFQWCTQNMKKSYIECNRCLEKIKRIKL